MSEKLLNEEQTSAIEHGEGPMLVIAGAGTGKTTVITERIRHLLLNKKISPDKILALTFTEKAASEMESRIDKILPYGYSQLWIETFHAFADRLLRQDGIHIGVSPNFKLMTEAESLMFLKTNLYHLKLSYFRPLGNPTKFLQALLSHFSRLKEDDITPAAYRSFAEKLKKSAVSVENKLEAEKYIELSNVYEEFEKLKLTESLLSFSDLVPLVLKLFKDRPNILKKYQDKFDYILVDEFQDTNFAQNELALTLSGTRGNVTVVGDDDQSIYRFRGAAVSNILQFKSKFPNTKIITLNKNYRSTQHILDSAYKLIQNNNPDRLEVKEKISKKLIAVNGEKGTKPEFLYATNPEDEAQFVAKKILKLVKDNHYKYRDFAILVRANDHSLIFQKILQRNHIPFQFLGPARLYHQEEIKDLIAYFQVLANYENDSALYRVLDMDVFDIDSRDLATILVNAKKHNVSLFEQLEDIDDLTIKDQTKDNISKIIKIIHFHLSELTKTPPDQILYGFFEESGLLGFYLDPDSKKTENQAENVALFFEKIQRFVNNTQDANVFNLVDWLEMSMDLGESPLASESDWTANNAVNILTAHSAKGLEFPVVFVVNLVTSRFPSRARRETIPVPDELIREVLPTGDEHLQEERRLFYVALTRAKDQLYLTASSTYSNSSRKRIVSPFVYETMDSDEIIKLIEKDSIKTSASQLSLLETLKPPEDSTDKDKHVKKQNDVKLDFISYSQITTFEMCPLHYKLRYIMKLPTVPSAAISFGTTVHSILNVIYKMDFHNNPISQREVEELVENYMIYSGYENRSHIKEAKEKAKNLIINFIKDNKDEKTKPIETEKAFNFFVDETKVIGRFDRIDRINDNQIEIIDYKTGSNIPNDRALKNNKQLSLYALAASLDVEPLFQRKPEDVLLSLYYVEEGKKITTTRSEEQLKETKLYISEIIERIKTSDFKCSSSIMCKNCEYKMLCNAH